MKLISLVFLWVILFSVALESNGQYTFSRWYTSQDGLAPGWVNDISQDSLGYLWLANRNGLSRFDGRNFTNYYSDLEDTQSLPASEIFDVEHLPNGDAWIATAKGLSKYHRANNSFTSYNAKSGLTLDIVRKVLVENDSILWTGHWWGLDRININNWHIKHIHPHDTLNDRQLLYRSPNAIRCLKKSPFDQSIYAAFRSAIHRYSGKSKKMELLLDIADFAPGWISDFNWQNEQTLLIGVSEQSYYLVCREEEGEFSCEKNENGNEIIKVIRKDNGNLFLLDLHKGFQKKGSGEFIDIKNKNDLNPDLNYRDLWEDKEGGIWLATPVGLAKFEKSSTRLFSPPHEIDIHTAHFDPETRVCLTDGYQGQQFWKFQDNLFVPIDFDFTPYFYHRFFFSSELERFVGFGDEQIVFFQPEKNRQQDVILSQPIKSGRVAHIMDREGVFLLAIDQDIYAIDDQGDVRKKYSLPEKIFDFTFSKEKMYWSTLGKIYAYDLSTDESKLLYEKDNLTPPMNLMCLGDTALWFSQVHIGLAELNVRDEEATCQVYGPEQGINSQIVHSFDRHKNSLFLAASYSILEFDLSTKKVIKEYSKSDKFKALNYDGPIHLTENGDIFTTSFEGILLFPKNQRDPAIYDLSIRSLQNPIGKYIYNTDSNFQFKYIDNNLSIEMEAAYYGDPSDLNFAYKLSGEEEEWTTIGSIGELNFVRLPPGNYQLDISVSTINGQSLTKHNALNFVIKAPWYQSWWFRFLLAGILFLSFYLWNRWRIKAIRKDHEVEKKLIHLEQLALKSQMNPHFLFNCLNGIRTLIKLNDEDQAIQYVNHLSRLLRDTLQFTAEQSVSLQKEVEMTENYLMLGKLRFGEKVNWRVEIDPQVDLANIQVPPFILQPLVENAIWHGLKHLEGNGMIEIAVQKNIKTYIITIQDNGIGLEKAAEIRQGQLRTRKHIGLSLVQRRLELINGKLEIKNREDGSGVKAQLTIPQ